MILDSGICTVFKKVTVSQPGAMPVFGYQKVTQSWYKALSYGTSARASGGVTELQDVAMRIRMLRNTGITNHCCVVLQQCDTMPTGCTVYEVINAYHDTDQDNGEQISDLYLGVYEP